MGYLDLVDDWLGAPMGWQLRGDPAPQSPRVMRSGPSKGSLAGMAGGRR
jgi:hypothetical protein